MTGNNYVIGSSHSLDQILYLSWIYQNERKNRLLGKDNAGTEETEEKNNYLHQLYYELHHFSLI